MILLTMMMFQSLVMFSVSYLDWPVDDWIVTSIVGQTMQYCSSRLRYNDVWANKMMNAWRQQMNSRTIFTSVHPIAYLIWILLHNLSLIINMPETVLQVWNWFEVTWWLWSISNRLLFWWIERTWCSSMNRLLYTDGWAEIETIAAVFCSRDEEPRW